MNQESNDQHWKVLVLLLKEMAKEKKITREDIAEKTGMKASSISRIFSLRYRVTLANFIAIAQAVGVNFYLEDKDSKTDLNQMMERDGRSEYKFRLSDILRIDLSEIRRRIKYELNN